jgi:Sulfotransferase domain
MTAVYSSTNVIANAAAPPRLRAKAAQATVVPDFLILGAAKCGTTSLHYWLRQHPQILMSLPKEPVYFEAEYECGPDFYRSTYFATWDGRQLLGDARTANLYFPWVPARVQESNPNARLIILLRNPIDRALAHWWTEFRRDKEPLHFEQAIAANFARLTEGAHYEVPEEFWKAGPLYQMPRYTGARHPRAYHRPYKRSAAPRDIYRTYIDAGYYAEQIERYRQYFPDEQIRIYLDEDLRLRPKEVLREICQLIGVRSEPIERIDLCSRNVSQPMKRSKAIKYWLLQRLRGEKLPYAEIRQRPVLRPEFRRFLADHFRNYNADLSKLLNRDLSHWT